MMQKLKQRIEELENELKELTKGGTQGVRLIVISKQQQVQILKEWLEREEEILKLTRFSRDNIGMYVNPKGEFISYEDLKKEIKK